MGEMRGTLFLTAVALSMTVFPSVGCGPFSRPYGCDEPGKGPTGKLGDELAVPQVSCEVNVLVTQPTRCDEARGIVPNGPPTRTDCAAVGLTCTVAQSGLACARGCKVNGECPADQFCEDGKRCAAALRPGQGCSDNATDTNAVPRCAAGSSCLQKLSAVADAGAADGALPDAREGDGGALDKQTCCDTGGCMTSSIQVVCFGECR